MNKKFKFIELPRPEFTLSEESAASLVGGLHCPIKYTQCSGEKNNCALDPHGSGYNKDSNCNGNSLGCEGTFYCQYTCFDKAM